MRFIYSSGQRPLDGYTLKRGIGRGGFGEVYYAVTDGGKEVALKLVNQNADIELRGIVHRDLKPGNIFIENGVVKVGDYGLSKLIGGSQVMSQTQSVGTVHYMAPEISTGNYNRSIDIYAAGVILYEMLSGRVPFEGESAGEILMKHMTSLPDMSKLPSPFVPVLDQALAKNPARRYRNIGDMARDVA